MKRLTMTAILLIALTTGAIAHQGSIGLYTDTSAMDCDVTLTPYVGYDVTIMYFKSDAGPDGISATEFKIDAPGTIILGAFTPSPDVSASMGTINTSLAVTFSGCTGSGLDYVLIGTVNIVALGAAPMMMQVMVGDGLLEPPLEPRVTTCVYPRPIVGVLGGYFAAPDGGCDIGTEEKSWGAIKDMYSH